MNAIRKQEEKARKLSRKENKKNCANTSVKKQPIIILCLVSSQVKSRRQKKTQLKL